VDDTIHTIKPLTTEEHQEGLEQNVQVKPERQMIYIPDIQLNTL
jgi:hypothetical protein